MDNNPHLLALCNGKSVDIFDADSIRESVDLEVIATGLSNKCRYNGQTKDFYSVAMHCIHLANWFMVIGNPELIPIALMHDCAEAILPDIPAPIKEFFGVWHPDSVMPLKLDAFELSIQCIIFAKFGLDINLLDAINDADIAIRETEMHYLFGSPEPKELMFHQKSIELSYCPKIWKAIFLKVANEYIPCQ